MQAILAAASTLELHLSTDAGVTWSQVTHPQSGYQGMYAYGNDVWLYVQSNNASNNVAFVTADLETWAPVTLPVSRNWKRLAFMLGEFYLFCTEAFYYKSADGENWTAHAAPITTAVYSLVAASPGLIMLVDRSYLGTTNVYTTADGLSWALASAHTVPSGAERRGLAWTGSAFSMLNSGGSTQTLDKSANGASWSSSSYPAGRNPYAADSVIGIALSSSNTAAYTWAGESASASTVTIPSMTVYDAKVFGGTIMVASSSGVVRRSTDGASWFSSTAGDGSLDIHFLFVGELPDSPPLHSTLSLSDLLEGSVSEVAISHDTLTFSSSALSLTELFSETYFDTLLLSDILTSSQSLTADLVSTLYMSTLIGGVVLEDGGRVLLSEPIQYGVNVATGALTRYQGFGFDSYARCGQTLYGLRADGLYRIRPGSDNGEPIQVAIDLGDTPFSEEQGKRIEAVYLGISTDGDAYVRLKAGEVEYTYKAIQHDEIARATPGKGLTGRRWTLSLEVVDATELTLDMVEVRYGASARRLRGKR